MTENNPLKKISLLNPIHLLAIGFGSGLIYPAPGTWGSLAGTIFRRDFAFFTRRKNLFNFYRTLFSTRLLPLSKNYSRYGGARSWFYRLG